MNKYDITLLFPEVSQSVSLTLTGDSIEAALTKVQKGTDTRLRIEANSHLGKDDPDGDQESVSHVYIETIRVPGCEITNIYTQLFAKGDLDGNISKTARFPDGLEMDVSCCKDPEEPGWTEAALFLDGNECEYTVTRNRYEGAWSICYKGVMYITVVVPEVNKWVTPNIIILPGSCLDSMAQVIAHQTNCKGVMGAGVAKSICEKYPEIMPEYQAECRSRNMLGKCQLIAASDERYIANLFGQNGFGSGVQTNYNALRSALHSLVELMQSRRLISVSMPYNIGCGLAGGDWNVVFDILRNTFTGTDIRLELWDISL